MTARPPGGTRQRRYAPPGAASWGATGRVTPGATLLATLRATLLATLLLAACRGDAPTGAGEPPVLPPPVPATAFPELAVTTAGGAPITSRELYLAGSWQLVAGRDSAALAAARPESVLATGTLEIRGRGNSTWWMPKKPYRVKLAASAPLLGMPASRHWVLLANYADKTLMRNDAVLALGEAMGMAWTPRARFVHLTLNGRYEGLYQLAEHVRIAPDRINIPELKRADTTAEAITGGYQLEVDETRGEAFCFQTGRTVMVFCANNPETLLEPGWERHRAYITGYVRDLEGALFGPDFAHPDRGYAAWLDVPSAVDWYLVNELVKNVDGNLRRSAYLVKPRGAKLAFGPLWDYDLALGNVNYDGADRVEGWHVRTAPWFTRLFQDPAFQGRVRARWRQLRADGTLDRLRQRIMFRWDDLQRGQQRNFTRWPILSTWVWPNRVVTGSFGGEVSAMLTWLDQRMAWMDANL